MPGLGAAESVCKVELFFSTPMTGEVSEELANLAALLLRGITCGGREDLGE